MASDMRGGLILRSSLISSSQNKPRSIMETMMEESFRNISTVEIVHWMRHVALNLGWVT
jgi:hypothetical protein